MLKHEKPDAFYDTFERKGPGDRVPHYCPGCGHGNVHKLIAEAISDLGIKNKTVFLSPVGCGAFAYYYFDTGNIACSHGRAPAVGTGVARSLKDAVVISYQGDGDLAGIGTAEILHAANRGERMAVFFINNGIYGMTGGQMAPTTLLGQRTMTSPLGRTMKTEGGPIHMAEILNQLDAPFYIERVSLGDPPRILKARKAVRRALENQLNGGGFSFVEVLSPCPVGWKMSPVEARTWLREEMEKVYPLNLFRNRNPENEETIPKRVFEKDGIFSILGIDETTEKIIPAAGKHSQVKIAGFGGQGVLSMGILFANCAIAEGLNASWLPSYGPEMRGGTANASVVISTEAIGSPAADNPDLLIVMNGPSLDLFEKTVAENGTVIINSSMTSEEPLRKDIKIVKVPATDLARAAGFIKGANIIMLTVGILVSGIVTLATLEQIMPRSLKRKEFLDINNSLIRAGVRFYEENF